MPILNWEEQCLHEKVAVPNVLKVRFMVNLEDLDTFIFFGNPLLTDEKLTYKKTTTLFVPLGASCSMVVTIFDFQLEKICIKGQSNGYFHHVWFQLTKWLWSRWLKYEKFIDEDWCKVMTIFYMMDPSGSSELKQWGWKHKGNIKQKVGQPLKYGRLDVLRE